MTPFLYQLPPHEIFTRLEELIARFANDLEEGALISVTDQNVRVRRLPAI